MRRGIYAVLQRDLDGFIAAMNRMGMIAPGAEAGVRESVGTMFGRIQDQGGGLGVGGRAVLGLKDEAKTLLQDTPGLQLPNDLLLFAKTVTYLMSLGHELAPDVDMVRLCLPYLLQFLAEKDPADPQALSS
jgi:predicted unusual protein kinase regulating ubiquinone biosynthesis (AarF/ABC1/UbiB family)